MRQLTTLGIRTVAAVLLTTALVAGCSDDDSDPQPAPSPTGPPTKDELKAAHTAYHELGDLYDDADDGAGKYQQTVVAISKKNPASVLTDPDVTDALTEQQALADKRDQATADLGEQAAMRDPDLEAAYEKFATAAQKMTDFQDAFNESFPTYLRSLDVCAKIFEIKPDVGLLPSTYAKSWLAEHAKAAAPCLKILADLDGSENYQLRKYAANFHRVIDQRTDTMTALRDGDATLAQTSARLERVNEAFTKRNRALTDFNAEMAELNAADEYAAIDDVFEQKLGTSH